MNGVNGVHVDNFSMEGVYVNGDFTINNADDDQIENVKLVKCRLGTVNLRENTDRTILRQCDIEGNISGNSTVASALMVQNCYVSGEINGFNTSSSVVIDHCVLAAADGNYSDYYHGPYVYKNSIINRFLGTGAVAVNCIGGQSFITKLSAGIATMISGVVFSIVGWSGKAIEVANAALANGEEHFTTMNGGKYALAMFFLVSVPPAIGMLLSAIPTWKYALPNTEHKRILSELVTRRRAAGEEVTE